MYMRDVQRAKAAEKNEKVATDLLTGFLRGVWLRRIIPSAISSAATKRSG
jgi:hypothetical protein